MAPKQRMRIANEKASKYVTMRGNVPKSSVSFIHHSYRLQFISFRLIALQIICLDEVILFVFIVCNVWFL